MGGGWWGALLVGMVGGWVLETLACLKIHITKSNEGENITSSLMMMMTNVGGRRDDSDIPELCAAIMLPLCCHGSHHFIQHPPTHPALIFYPFQCGALHIALVMEVVITFN